ncbi:hypothetical protein ACFLSQ_08460 [Bacteroidota bacterium]
MERLIIRAIYFILMIFLFFPVNQLYGNELNDITEVVRDSIQLPVIDIIPSEIVIDQDSSRFVVKKVSVLNRGGGILKMNKVSGSCYCSNAVIMKNDIYPLDLGELRLEINKEGLSDGSDTVIYTVKSNAKNSPFFIKVRFVSIDSDSSDINFEK